MKLFIFYPPMVNVIVKTNALKSATEKVREERTDE